MTQVTDLEKPTTQADLLSRIGATPLIRLTRVADELPPGVEIYGKAEWFNPGGSVKDRPALNMILEGERSGRLKPGKILLDATSGNTGIAYAMICAVKGYRVRLCLPQNASEERRRILMAYGAELVLTSPQEGSDGAIRMARKLFAERPDLYFYPDQYGNEANWRAHYMTTAVEIWEQTEHRVTHFVAGLGTSGTFVGTSRRLKELNPAIQCISFQPDSPFHGLEGLKHMDTAIVPRIYDPNLADDELRISTEAAYRMVKRAAREEGLFIGISSGAAIMASLEVARRVQRGIIVTILCDGGDKYLSERFWDEEI
ncbi:MAG: cysteine synthase family protein [Acidobacteriia bacterium]|nr:cysteine synthase family protein [Terriglobia bacterium]